MKGLLKVLCGAVLAGILVISSVGCGGAPATPSSTGGKMDSGKDKMDSGKDKMDSGKEKM